MFEQQPGHVIEEIKALPSGKLAALCGGHATSGVDQLRRHLAQFAGAALSTGDSSLRRWEDAWDRFLYVEADMALAVREGRGVHAPALNLAKVPPAEIEAAIARLSESAMAPLNPAVVEVMRERDECVAAG